MTSLDQDSFIDAIGYFYLSFSTSLSFSLSVKAPLASTLKSGFASNFLSTAALTLTQRTDVEPIPCLASSHTIASIILENAKADVDACERALNGEPRSTKED